MSSEWRNKIFDNYHCSGILSKQIDGDIVIKGKVKTNNPNPIIVFWASNPPTYNSSFSGSGLPYPNPTIAYENSKNTGIVKANNYEFTFRINYPNAYYVGLGSVYIPPHVHIKICEPNGNYNITSIKIDDGIPFRTLTYPSPPSKKPRISPMFYAEPEKEVRTQEQILRDSGYPAQNVTPDNFWGLRPPR